MVLSYDNLQHNASDQNQGAKPVKKPERTEGSSFTAEFLLTIPGYTYLAAFH